MGARIVVGEEIRTPDGDVIGLFLTERIPYVLPLAEVTARIRAQGGLVYVPHPFDLAGPASARVLPGLCADGRATSSRCSTPRSPIRRSTTRPRSWPRGSGCRAGRARTRTTPDGVGAAYLEMPDFDGPAGFLAALAAAQITGEHRPHAVRYPRRPAAR